MQVSLPLLEFPKVVFHFFFFNIVFREDELVNGIVSYVVISLM